jgi:hypothetical protein
MQVIVGAMPNWLKWIGRKLGQGWYSFGQASRAYTLFQLLSGLASLGLAGIAAGLLAHVSRVLTFFDKMSSEVRSVVFGGVFLIALAAMLAFLQWAALRYRPAWLATGPSPTEHARLAEQAAEVEQLRAKVQTLTEEAKGLLNHIKYVEGVSRQHFERLVFGETLPEPQPQGRATFQQVFSGLYELRPSLRSVVAETDRVWSNLSAMIRAQESDHRWRMLVWRLSRLERGERGQFAQAANALDTVLEARQGDPRPYLAAVYNTYRRWRNQIAEVGLAFGHPVALVNGAIEWRDAERRFLEILERKLEVPELDAVRQARLVYDEKHGPLEDIFSA